MKSSGDRGSCKEIMATEGTKIIAQTWATLRHGSELRPLVQTVEKIATENITKYPGVPFGLLVIQSVGWFWLEVLYAS
jgi:hypothetical protein